MNRLAEIAARAEAATPPSEGSTSWIVARPYGHWFEIYTGPLADDSSDIASHIFRLADAQFIAAARTDVPWLLAEVERLRAEQAAAVAAVASLVSALGRTEQNFVSAVRSVSVRDMCENLAENGAAFLLASAVGVEKP